MRTDLLAKRILERMGFLDKDTDRLNLIENYLNMMIKDDCKPSVLSDWLSAANQAVEALLCAKKTIRAFHGEVAWDIYDKNSPEMKQINGAIDQLAKTIILGGG